MSDRTFYFTVDNQLLSEIGERLVAKNYIALAELIKNAYDADAERVEVFLNTAAKGGGQIVVRDYGQGMTAEEVERYWMRVATDHKIREPRTTRYGRYKSGSKGIGRFACRRLAERLELKSVARKDGTFEVTEMSFKWKDLKPGKDLATEQFKAHVTTSPKEEPGLTLTMSGLTERWTQRDFNILRRSLVDVSIAGSERRQGFKADPGFVIELHSEQFETDDITLADQYLNSGWGRLIGSVSNRGSVGLSLKAKGSGTKIYDFDERFDLCGGVSFDIAWIPGDKELLRDPAVMTHQVRKQLQDTVSGVRVYLDGFRVYPYGEFGNDWLDISRTLVRRLGGVDKRFASIARKLGVDPTRAMLDHPKETTLLGKVVVPPNAAKQFVVKMDREGFVEDRAFQQLKELVRLSLEWMTVQYTSFKQKVNEDRLEDDAADLGLKDLEESLKDPAKDKSPAAALNAALAVVERVGKKGVEVLPGGGKTLTTAANVIRRSTDVMDAKVAKLQILASTGPVVFAFAHEIKAVIARLATHANELERVLEKLEGTQAALLRRVIQDMRDTRKRLDHQVELFGTFSTSLSDDKPERQKLREVLDEVVAGFAFLNETFEIEPDQNGVAGRLRTPLMRSAEIYSVVVNLYSNALKSCMAAGGHKIKITAESDDGAVVMKFLDSGVGLQEGYWERVFEPLVADPENKIYPRLAKLLKDEDVHTLGKGSGLGLSIVKDIVRARGGTVRFTKPPQSWRACVEVVLR